MTNIEDNIPMFISITNCPDSQTAHNYLEMCSNDLNQAIQLYFDTGAAPPQPIQPEDNYQPPMTFNTGVLNRYSDDEDEFIVEEEDNERFMIPEVQYGGIGGYYSTLSSEHDSSSDLEIVEDQSDSDFYNSSEESDDSNVVEVDYYGNVKTKESHAEKLRRMFSKPTDIIFERGRNIEALKKFGKAKNKWIIVNIQDVNNFECMKLNRDIWSDPEIKTIIRKYFLFNQFDKTQSAGREYMFLYPLENKVPGIVRIKNPDIDMNDGVVRDDFGDRVELPVIGLVDPLTGALMESWNGGIRDKRVFIEELNKFVDLYVHNNPDAVVLPDDEEEQKEVDENKEDVAAPTPEISQQQENPAEDAEEVDEFKQLFDKIQPLEYAEPPASTPSTRIQFRMFNSGKRLVKKFALDNKVEDLFSVCKSDRENFPEGTYFELHLDGSNLIEHLGKTIDEMNLKMSSLTVEFIE